MSVATEHRQTATNTVYHTSICSQTYCHTITVHKVLLMCNTHTVRVGRKLLLVCRSLPKALMLEFRNNTTQEREKDAKLGSLKWFATRVVAHMYTVRE